MEPKVETNNSTPTKDPENGLAKHVEASLSQVLTEKTPKKAQNQQGEKSEAPTDPKIPEKSPMEANPQPKHPE